MTTPTPRAWISGECADGFCGMCPGEPLTDDLPPCAHKCHTETKEQAA